MEIRPISGMMTEKQAVYCLILQQVNFFFG